MKLIHVSLCKNNNYSKNPYGIFEIYAPNYMGNEFLANLFRRTLLRDSVLNLSIFLYLIEFFNNLKF